jgi:hypothetical protein
MEIDAGERLRTGRDGANQHLLLDGSTWLLLLRLGRQRVDHLARLGVVQFFPLLVLHRFGIGLQPLDVLPKPRVLLLQVLDLPLQLMVFGAFLLPHLQPVISLRVAGSSRPEPPGTVSS